MKRTIKLNLSQVQYADLMALISHGRPGFLSHISGAAMNYDNAITRLEVHEVDELALGMRELINSMADYVADRGYRVRLDHTAGECVVCIEGPDGNIRLSDEGRYQFIEQMNKYAGAMNGNVEAAWLAAAKPYVEKIMIAC